MPLNAVLICFCLILLGHKISSKHYLIETENKQADTTNADYEDIGQWTNEVPSKYLDVYNKLSKKDKLKVKKMIMETFGNDKQKVMKAAKSGELDKIIKMNEDYLLDLFMEKGSGWDPTTSHRPTGPSGGGQNSGGGGGSCFPGSAKVVTPQGVSTISALKLGDQVLTYQPGTGPIFTQFLGWLDKSSTGPKTYLRLLTQSQGEKKNVSLTGNHVLFTVSPTGDITSSYARDVKPGDHLAYWIESGLETQEVVEVKSWVGQGFWSPLTEEGSLLVDGGFFASCISSYPHRVGLLASSLRRLPYMSSLLLDDKASEHKDGDRNMVMLGKAILNSLGLKHWGWETKSQSQYGNSTKKWKDMSQSLGYRPIQGIAKY